MTHYQDVLDRLRADKGLAHQRDMIAPTVDGDDDAHS